MNFIIFKNLKHVIIIIDCGNIHQRKHWLDLNQPVLLLMDIAVIL